MSKRLARVSEVIKREISANIEREHVFRSALVTVTHVDVTPDLKQAHAFISVLGSKADKVEIMEQLEAHRASFQSNIAKRVVLKYTPKLHFKLDDSIERGNRVIDIMDQIDIPQD